MMAHLPDGPIRTKIATERDTGDLRRALPETIPNRGGIPAPALG